MNDASDMYFERAYRAADNDQVALAAVYAIEALCVTLEMASASLDGLVDRWVGITTRRLQRDGLCDSADAGGIWLAPGDGCGAAYYPWTAIECVEVLPEPPGSEGRP